MLRCYYELEVFGKDRHVKTKPKLSRSFVRQFLEILYREYSNLSFSIKDTDNSSQSDSAYVGHFNIMTHGGNGDVIFEVNSSTKEVDGDKLGVVVGTGSTAVTVSDFALGTKINHGTSSGEMEHFGGFVSDVTVNATTDEATFNCESIFRNGSGSSITVNEIGLYSIIDSNSNSAMLIRDLIGGGQAVADTEYLKVTYTIKIAT